MTAEAQFEKLCMEESQFALSLRDSFDTWEETYQHLQKLKQFKKAPVVAHTNLGMINPKALALRPTESNTADHIKWDRLNNESVYHLWADEKWVLMSRKRGKSKESPMLTIYDVEKAQMFTTHLTVTTNTRVSIHGHLMAYATHRQLFVYSLAHRKLVAHYGIMPTNVENLTLSEKYLAVMLANHGMFLFDRQAYETNSTIPLIVQPKTDDPEDPTAPTFPHAIHIPSDPLNEMSTMILTAAFHPLMDAMVTGNNMGEVFLWRLLPGKPLQAEKIQDLTCREDQEFKNLIMGLTFHFNSVVYHSSDHVVIYRFPNGEDNGSFFVYKIPGTSAAILRGDLLFVLTSTFALYMIDTQAPEGEDLRQLHTFVAPKDRAISSFANFNRRLTFMGDAVVSTGQSGIYRIARFQDLE